MRCLSFTLVLLSLMMPGLSAEGQSTVFMNGTILTLAGETLENGAVRVEQGRITAVGPASEINLEADEVIDLSGGYLMPGLVDTHSHVAITGRPRGPGGSDSNERKGSVHPALRALDAVNPRDPGIRMALAGGVTTANIMPGSGNLVGGQTVYVKYRGDTVSEMLIDNNGITGGLKMANGENPKRRGSIEKIAPGTRMANAAMQRKMFVDALNYRETWRAWEADKKGKRPDRDIGLEAILEVLDGRRVVHFHTHRADDIMTAIRLSEEYGFRIVLQHVTEGFRVADEIARRGIPSSVIVVDSPGGKHEVMALKPDNAVRMAEQGALIAFHTDDSVTDSRFFLRSAALAVREGLDRQTALAALTINGARMLDLGDRIGSIEPGKDADLIVLDGDPFSVYTRVRQTWIEGEKVFDFDDPADRAYATGGFARIIAEGEAH